MSPTLFWALEHCRKWWFMFPAVILSISASTSGVFLLPTVGFAIAVCLGVLWTLREISDDELAEKDKTND